jgi:hypothetical protein
LLNQFLKVRKDKLLSALQYLVQNKEVTINHSMIESQATDCVPPDVIHAMDSDHRECDDYTVGLQAGNFENDIRDCFRRR